ncbi:MAG: DUF2971 domain-containing protein [Verrucomicrobia bacterium]|nr:DUF2971 domain-containing protein [Verrucomicrobiota bacterium]
MSATIYKYATAEVGALILKNLTLKATRPDEFNNPFEFTPRMSEQFDMARLHGLYQHAEEAARFSETPAPANFKETLQAVMANPQILHLIAPDYAAMCRNLVKTYSSKVAGNTGVICFSRRRDRILMWTHYADQHKGIVIGFDSSHFPKLFDVKYDKERVLVDPFPQHIPGSESEENYVYKLITTKHEDWSYEEECRQLHKLPERAVNEGVHNVPFPAESIVSIAVGMRYAGTGIAEVLSSRGLQLQLERAVPHPHEFTVAFESFK